MQIVPARPDQAEALTQISIAAKRHWNYPERWMQIWRPLLTISAKYIASNETWTAVVDHEPIAYCSLTQQDGDLWLDHLWVLPEQMGKGYGKSLLEHALGRCRQRGALVLKIEADPNAQSFYERMGAYQVGERRSEVDSQPRVLPVMEIKVYSG